MPDASTSSMSWRSMTRSISRLGADPRHAFFCSVISTYTLMMPVICPESSRIGAVET